MLRFFLLGLLSILPALAQSEHPLTGRKIAPVMGVGGAGWLERSERESEEAPEKALDALDLQKGMAVADVGAGTGYFSLRMARRVGPDGKVYANDVQPEMLEKLVAPVPLRRLGQASEIAHAARFIFQNDYYTGRTLELDGGLRM